MGEDRSRIRINPGVFARLLSFAFNILIPNPIDRNLRPAEPAEAPNGARRRCGVAKRAEARAGA